MTTYFFASLQTELLKIRKSKVVFLTAAAFTIAPLMAGFFIFVLKNPEWAKSSGLLGAKAQIAGDANWPSYLNMYAQIIAVGGSLIFGFIVSWIFGREYTDRTIKDLLALPYSRSLIVISKFTASLITNLVVTLYIVILGLLIGWFIGLPQFSQEMMFHGLYVIFVVTMLTILISTPVAFLASYGKGYLAPLGFIIIVVVFSQIIAASGYGEYFPWSITALYSGITGEPVGIKISSLFIIFITGILGFFSTLYWWLVADQH